MVDDDERNAATVTSDAAPRAPAPPPEDVAPVAPIAAGQTVGPYEILGLLGSGGMGQVFRARDTRLGRQVALKALPAEMRAHPERLRRFSLEARAAGALNHPNIVAVYDVGSHGGIPWLVTELLEGSTLGAMLDDGPIAPRRALDLAAQLARGLAALHGKGMVHRDLKPENVFVTQDGRVKILDFGIIKLVEPDEGTGQADESVTGGGAILGTAGYMAPEQIRGQPIDARADLFAFGSVLYEMLTGKRAFKGGSPVETMNLVLTHEPPPPSELGVAVSPPLERLLARCLAKSPDERLGSARDLALTLEALADEGPPSRRLAPAPSPRRRWWAVAALAALAVVVAGGAAALWVRPTTASLPTFQPLTFHRGAVIAARFVPGDQTVVFGAAWEDRPVTLFTTRPGNTSARSLELPETLVASVSATGELAVLLHARRVDQLLLQGVLARVPLSGGAPRELVEDVEAADWTPDGKELAVVRATGGRRRLELPVGTPVYETLGWIANVRVSPDGAVVAFVDHPQLGNDDGALTVVDRAGKTRLSLPGWSSIQGLAWKGAEPELWFTAAKVGAHRDLLAASLGGVVRAIHRGAISLTLHDVASDGRVLLAADDKRWLINGRAPGSDEERDLSWLDGSIAWDLSPDGRQLLIGEVRDGGGPGYSVYLRSTDGEPPVRLGDGDAQALSPDGQSALALLVTAEPPHLVVLPTGPGQPRPLAHADVVPHLGARWFPDGKRILYAGHRHGERARLYVQDVAGGAPRPFTPEGVSHYVGGNPIAPDGSAVAAAGADGTPRLYPLSGGAPEDLPGAGPRTQVIRWSEDGGSLYVFAHGAVPAEIHRLERRTGRSSLWRVLAPPDRSGVVHVCPIVMTPDGSGYAYTYARQLSQLFLVNGLR